MVQIVAEREELDEEEASINDDVKEGGHVSTVQSFVAFYKVED